MRRTIDFLGITVDVVDTEGLFNRIVDFVEARTPRKVTYLNAHCTVMAMNDPVYKGNLNNHDLVYADGQGVVWASKLIGPGLPCRSTGADFLPRFCERFAEKKIRLFFLGAEPGVADSAAKRLEEKIPALSVVGTHHGYLDGIDDARLVAEINEAKPDILIVGMGVPLQENWVEKNFSSLDIPVVWSVGALFNFISGDLARGPRFLVDHGFEWLCRLFIEPRRLWRRFIFGNMKFIYYVVSHKLSSKRSRCL